MNLYTFTTGLLSIGLYASVAFANGDGKTEAPHDSSDIDMPTPEVFQIVIESHQRTTSSIEISWSIGNFTANSFVVESRKVDGDAITKSPETTELEYIIEDLVVDQEYEVCVIVSRDEGEDRECSQFSTIVLIRDDSIFALFCALGYIGLCALIGYLVWKYHSRKLQVEAEEDEEPINPEGKHAPSGPLRSSIEDEDIPYITPPVDQLSKEDKANYTAAV